MEDLLYLHLQFCFLQECRIQHGGDQNQNLGSPEGPFSLGCLYCLKWPLRKVFMKMCKLYLNTTN